MTKAKQAESIIGEPSKLSEFYYMDANAVKELPRTVLEKIKIITRFVTSPEDMNVLCGFTANDGLEPTEWALETSMQLKSANSIDFKILNEKLMERYKLLNSSFLSKLQKHREKQYFLASSEGFSFVTKEYSTEQVSTL